MKQNDEISNQMICPFNNVLEEYKVDKTIIESKNFKRDYGWTFPLGKNLNFRNLSELVDFDLYKDYKHLCQYSHGVSILQKHGIFTFYDTIISMYFRFYYCIQSLFISTYCDSNDKNEQELRKTINLMIHKELENLKNNDF